MQSLNSAACHVWITNSAEHLHRELADARWFISSAFSWRKKYSQVWFNYVSGGLCRRAEGWGAPEPVTLNIKNVGLHLHLMDLVRASYLYSVFMFVPFLRELSGVIGIRSNMKTVRRTWVTWVGSVVAERNLHHSELNYYVYGLRLAQSHD